MIKPHPRLETVLAVTSTIADAAALAARSAQRQVRRATRPRRGLTLRPGVDTPLWNELVRALRESLTRHGDKAVLARYLGLPRQRLNNFLTDKSALPDAERTLLLLHWLESRKRGINPV